MLILVFSSNTQAQDIGNEIRELNFGNCWVQDNFDHVKVASFNQNTSTSLDYEAIGQLIESYRLDLQSFSFSEVKYYDVAFVCKSQSSEVSIRVTSNLGQVACLRSNLLGDEKLLSLTAAKALENNGFCLGHTIGQIMFKTEEFNSLKEYLSSGQFNEFIETIEKEESYGAKVILKSSYNFKEEEVLRSLKEMFKKDNFSVEDIHLSDINEHISDYINLKSLGSR